MPRGVLAPVSAHARNLNLFNNNKKSNFTLISAHTNFHDPRSTPSGTKVREAEEEKRENNSVNRGHYVCHAVHLQCSPSAMQRGQRTHFALTKIYTVICAGY